MSMCRFFYLKFWLFRDEKKNTSEYRIDPFDRQVAIWLATLFLCWIINILQQIMLFILILEINFYF